MHDTSDYAHRLGSKSRGGGDGRAGADTSLAMGTSGGATGGSPGREPLTLERSWSLVWPELTDLRTTTDAGENGFPFLGKIEVLPRWGELTEIGS